LNFGFGHTSRAKEQLKRFQASMIGCAQMGSATRASARAQADDLDMRGDNGSS
jgi:hypothetical protein